MADRLTAEQRSRNMSKIRGKDTGIELIVRKRLFHDGFRYRKNVKDLPGKPDIVLAKYKTVIFVHGCFWHVHDCSESHLPKSNSQFWQLKLSRNVSNDNKHYQQLSELGWRVIVVWECEIEHQLEECIARIESQLKEA